MTYFYGDPSTIIRERRMAFENATQVNGSEFSWTAPTSL